jgi:hypothetical protein
MTEEASTPDVWSRDRLMGKSVSFKGIAPPEENGNGKEPTLSPKQRRKSKVKAGIVDPMLWGQPGHLTEDEVDVYVSLSLTVEELLRMDARFWAFQELSEGHFFATMAAISDLIPWNRLFAVLLVLRLGHSHLPGTQNS